MVQLQASQPQIRLAGFQAVWSQWDGDTLGEGLTRFTAPMKENTSCLSREAVEILYTGDKYSITQGLQEKNIEMKIQCVCKSQRHRQMHPNCVMNQKYVKKMARIYQYARIAITAEKKLTQGRTTAVFGRHLSCSGEILRRQKQAFERVYKSHQNIKQIQDKTFLNTTNKLLLYNKC